MQKPTYTCTLKASSDIMAVDTYTTRHDTTACDTTSFFAHYNQNGSVHTYSARPSLVISTKSCCNKKTMEAIFAMCRSDIIKKTDSIEISPGFCTSMTQE